MTKYCRFIDANKNLMHIIFFNTFFYILFCFNPSDVTNVVINESIIIGMRIYFLSFKNIYKWGLQSGMSDVSNLKVKF